MKNTGIPISFGTTVVIGFIVGIAIACQTFYAFVLDNLKHLGALKAMGMSNFRLSMMLIIQSLTVGIIGFGLGLLATSAFAMGAIKNGQPPFFMPWQIPVVAFARHPGHLHARRAHGHHPPQSLRTRHGLPCLIPRHPTRSSSTSAPSRKVSATGRTASTCSSR